MITCVIGFLPLVLDLRDAHHRVTQPWYADYAGAGGNFGQILAHFRDLQVRGPSRGYFPDPNKIILVSAPRNVARAEELFHKMGIRVVMGSCYLVSFIGDWEAETTWLDGKAKGGSYLVRTLLGVAHKHP